VIDRLVRETLDQQPAAVDNAAGLTNIGPSKMSGAKGDDDG